MSFAALLRLASVSDAQSALRALGSEGVHPASLLAILGRAAEALRPGSDALASIQREASLFFAAQDRPVPPAIAAEIAGLAGALDPTLWRARLGHELSRPNALGGLDQAPGIEAIVSYRAIGTLLHVAAGNGIGAGLESLIYGLLGGNRNILRLSRQSPPVAASVLAALHAAGLPKDVASVVHWPSEREDIEIAVVAGVDGVVVWGGEDVVRSYRSKLGVGQKFVEYGPKLSFAVLTAEGRGDDAAFDGLAHDVFMYDQVSCASTQALFVEVAPGESADSVLGAVLDRCAAAFNRRLAAGDAAERDAHQAVEFLKTYERSRLQKAQGTGDFRVNHPQWLVALDKTPGARVDPSPLMRTLLVYPFADRADLVRKLRPIRRYLQSASLLSGAEQVDELAQVLWNAGVTRVVAAGRSVLPSSGAPHDGGFILANMTRIVSLEHPGRLATPWLDASHASMSAALARHLEAAAAAPFYARRLAQAGIRPGSALDWQRFHALPLLEKADLNAYGPPCSSDLLTRPLSEAHGTNLFTTGGSTGQPRYALYTPKEWEDGGELFAHAFRSAGITTEDRMMNLFQGGGLWSAFLATARGIELSAGLHLSTGNGMEPEQLFDVMDAFGVTAAFGLPTTYLRLADIAHARKRPLKLKKVLFGGEHMGPEAAAFVKDALGADYVRSSLYAAVDAGCIGYQCQHAGRGVHHGFGRYCYIEICDPVSGLPVEPGAEGDIVITNLSRKLYPIIRLRTGDRGRQVLERCGCGSPAFTFELLGRTDDMVRVSGANVFASDVARLCAAFPGVLSPMYQVIVTREGRNDALEVVLEVHAASQDERAVLEAVVRAKYMELADDLRDYLESGDLKHFKLSLSAPGTIKGNWKTGKTKTIDDRRKN